jgi:hypothetical protein
MELRKYMTENQMKDYDLYMKDTIDIDKELFCKHFNIEDIESLQGVQNEYLGNTDRIEILFARLIEDNKVDLFTMSAIKNEQWDNYCEEYNEKKN